MLAVLRIVSKRFKEICIWLDNQGWILGWVAIGTVIEEQYYHGKDLTRDLNVVFNSVEIREIFA